MFSNRSLNQLFAHRAEVNTFSLVCHRWRRIILPISYETVLITSKWEADDLAVKLRQRHQRIGHYIKKLRIDGGQGCAIYTILSKVPRLMTLCISLDGIYSKQNASSLCRGLKLVNPKHLVLRDERGSGNQEIRNVINILIECMTSTWTNLVLYDHPYDEFDWLDRNHPRRYDERHKRAKAISRALRHVPNLRTVYVPRAYYVDRNDIVLNAIKNPSVQRIYSRIFWEPVDSQADDFEAAMKAHPRLRQVIHLPLPGPWKYPVYAVIGDKNISKIEKKFTFYTFDEEDYSSFYSPGVVSPDEW